MGINCLTVIFNHLPYDEMMKNYNYHKEKVSNLRVIWDIKEIPPEQTKNPDNPEIMPMELEGLWGNLHKYFTFCLSWFRREDPEYFILMERDVCILTKDFEEKIITYMKEHKVLACFPWLESQWTNPSHPFAQGLQSLRSKQWTIPAMTVIRKDALQYYGQSLVHVPDYWGEIRFPTVLGEAGMHITANPYISSRFFQSPPKGPGIKEIDRTMSNETILQAIKEGWKVIHPVKDYNTYDFIRKEINEQEADKKISL